MLKVFLGVVPDEYVNDSEYFVSPDGVAHYYKLEVEGDTVRIMDTVGRYIPFDTDDLHLLANTLYMAQELLDAKKSAEDFLAHSCDRILEEYSQDGKIKVTNV